MLKPELVRESPRRTGGDRSLAGGLQHRASAQLAKISDTGRVRGKCGRATGVSPHAGRLYRPSVGRFGCAGTEVLPENWSKRSERKSGKMGGLKGGMSDEKDPLYGRADWLRIAASGDGNTGGRGDPEDGHLDADVLSMEEAVWPNGCGRNSAIEAARRGEPEAQAARG